MLAHVLRHNNWATVTLLDFCREVDPAILDLSARGTYGTVYGTLQHLVGAQQWYVQLITGEWLGERIRRTERRTLDELLAIARATGDRLLRIVEAEDPDRGVEVNEGRTSTVGVILAQCVHHGNEHRTQATTILGANGLVPPPISGWGYGRDSGISNVEE